VTSRDRCQLAPIWLIGEIVEEQQVGGTTFWGRKASIESLGGGQVDGANIGRFLGTAVAARGPGVAGAIPPESERRVIRKTRRWSSVERVIRPQVPPVGLVLISPPGGTWGH
jgi:hypothetical protein